MQAIIKGLEKVKQELAASENDGPVSEVFRKVFSMFMSILDLKRKIKREKEVNFIREKLK